jgi:murein tripeptide amidase MpaA
MLNPDGVRYGHYRTSLVGVDLNRRWVNPSRYLHPTIFWAKKIARMLHFERKIALSCDIHGHSKKKNVFMYGCYSPSSDINAHRNNSLIKLIPYLMS